MFWTSIFLAFITIMKTLGVIICFYDAGKGDHEKIEHRSANIIAGFVALIIGLWALLLYLGIIV